MVGQVQTFALPFSSPCCVFSFLNVYAFPFVRCAPFDLCAKNHVSSRHRQFWPSFSPSPLLRVFPFFFKLFLWNPPANDWTPQCSFRNQTRSPFPPVHPLFPSLLIFLFPPSIFPPPSSPQYHLLGLVSAVYLLWAFPLGGLFSSCTPTLCSVSPFTPSCLFPFFKTQTPSSLCSSKIFLYQHFFSRLFYKCLGFFS